MTSYDAWRTAEPDRYSDRDDGPDRIEETQDEWRARQEHERLQAEARRQCRMPWAPEPTASLGARIIAEAMRICERSQ